MKKLQVMKKKTWFCCKINVNNTSKSHNQLFKQEIPIRNHKKKVGILVYGEFEKLLDILKNNYDKYLPNDDISHIVMIKVGFNKKIFR